MKKLLVPLYKSCKKILKKTGIGRFGFARSINNFLMSHLKSNYVKIQDNKMFLDRNDSLGLSIKGIYEPFGTKLVKKEVKEGDVVLDLGANIGYYTLIFAKLVGKNGKVFAFEPEPNNFKLLKKNIEVNGYKNVILVQKAVLHKNGKIKFYVRNDNKVGSSVYDREDSNQCIEVESIQLDDFFKDYDGKIDFIKMDVEGAEGYALKGMFNLLNKNKNVKLLTEFLPRGLKKCKTNPKEYLLSLLKHNFKLYDVNEEEKKLKPININNILKTYTPEKENHTNLLFVREQIKLEK